MAKKAWRRRYIEKDRNHVNRLQRELRARKPDVVIAQRKVHWRRYASKRKAAKNIAFNKAKGPRFSAALTQNRAYAAADALVPRNLPRDVRDDVMSDIVLACLEVKLLLEEVPVKWKAFASAYWKGRDFFGTPALDAPVGEDGATLLDFIAAPDQDLDAAIDGSRS